MGKSSGQNKKKGAAENSHRTQTSRRLPGEFRNGPIASIDRKVEMPISVTISSFKCWFCSKYNY